MPPKQILAVIIRVFALWLAIHAVFYLSETWAKATQYSSYPPYYLTFALIILILSTLCILLEKFPLAVSQWLLKDSGGHAREAFDVDDWYIFGRILLGFWFAGDALTGLCARILDVVELQTASQIMSSHLVYRTHIGIPDKTLIYIVSDSLELLVALALLLGWKKIAAFVKSRRKV